VRPRAFTHEISSYVFEGGVTEEGGPLLGIPYLSPLGDDIEKAMAERSSS
jgi:hypothetical protein